MYTQEVINDDWRSALKGAFSKAMPLPKTVVGIAVFVFYTKNKMPYGQIAQAIEETMESEGISTEIITINQTRSNNPEVSLVVNRGE